MLRRVLSFCVLGLLAPLTGCPFLFPLDSYKADRLYDTSVVVKWNEVMLAAIRNSGPRPTVVSRSIFIVQTAMYDAWSQYDERANSVYAPAMKRPFFERTQANKEAAVSYAAYRALLDQFPGYEMRTGAYTRLLNDLGYEASDSVDIELPAGIGNVAAQAVLDARQGDGSNEAGNYAQVTSATYPTLYAPRNSADPASSLAPGGADFNPNAWQPLRVPNGSLVDANGIPLADGNDPTTFSDQTFLTPHWGAVTPFALTSGDQFRPPAPPQAGSDASYTDALGQTMTNDEAYNAQVDEVLEISAGLTDRQKVIAEYWADGPRSETPPGHWQALAHGVSIRDRHTLDDDVKMYFALSAAIFDSGISCWESKRAHDYIRPVSAIRHKYFGEQIEAWGGPDQGTRTINGVDWRPYQSLTFVTPPFAEFTSGHSTFSAAGAEVLTRFTGTSRFYDGVTVLYNEDFNSDGVPDLLGQHVIGLGGNMFEMTPSEGVVVLQWETFQDAADEAGISRIYGGIHFQDGDRRGRAAGKLIGAQAYELAERYWSGEAP